MTVCWLEIDAAVVSYCIVSVTGVAKPGHLLAILGAR
jgi:hypothetical protein